MTTLMPDCETRTITVDGDRLFVRMLVRGPPLLLLLCYPQTSVMWHRVAPNLADQYTLVMPELPGYGQSDAPASGPERYSKRRMAADCAAVLAALGYVQFGVVGHDRGARVAYRMALVAEAFSLAPWVFLVAAAAPRALVLPQRVLREVSPRAWSRRAPSRPLARPSALGCSLRRREGFGICRPIRSRSRRLGGARQRAGRGRAGRGAAARRGRASPRARVG